MTTKNQALKTFDELQVDALTEHAMKVWADPKSLPEHRDAAKRVLLTPPRDEQVKNMALLSSAEIAEYLRISGKLRGEDEHGEPLPQDATSRRGRAQDDVLAIASDLSRARRVCREVWLETGGPWTITGQCDDCRAECLQCGPHAAEHRRMVAMIAALKLTPHERRQEIAKLDAERNDDDQESLPEPETSLVTQPFNMPTVEPVEPSAADFIELDGAPSKRGTQQGPRLDDPPPDEPQSSVNRMFERMFAERYGIFPKAK